MEMAHFKRFIICFIVTILPLGVSLFQFDEDYISKTGIKSSILVNFLANASLIKTSLIFFSIIFLIHLLFVFVLWFFVEKLIDFLRPKKSIQFSFLCYTLVNSIVFSLNTLFFPLSFLMISWPKQILILNLALVIFITFPFFKNKVQSIKYWKIGNNLRLLTMIALIMVIMATFKIYPIESDSAELNNQRPNIILIGFDSLRVDHLANSNIETITPNIDSFIKDSYQFENTFTPFARTFPTIFSIFTARDPIANGARDNLVSKDNLIGISNSLPFLFKNKGYSTVIAIDETRFANIDNDYGFDYVISPNLGAADFLLAKIGDLPLCNLLQITFPNLYALLFPFHNINRAIHRIYRPQSFSNQIKNTINSIDNNKPIFMVTHFELAHWPYTWTEREKLTEKQKIRFEKMSTEDYQQAIFRVDKQFSELVALLNDSGRLENAVVVLYSDHGESFTSKFNWEWNAVDNSRGIFFPPNLSHGINVLDENQIKVLLTFRTFGKNFAKLQGKSTLNASLIDIGPTVLGLLNLKHANFNSSGCDLFGKGNLENSCNADRVIYSESGFYPATMANDGEIDQFKIAAETYGFYEIDQQGRLFLKPEFVKTFLESKQRIAISGGRFAASIPIRGEDQYIVGNFLDHSYFRIDKGGLFPGNYLKSLSLFRNLCERYQADSKNLDNFCLSKVLKLDRAIASEKK